MRTDQTWTETQPSGVKNTYAVSAPITVEGIAGTELKKADGSATLFLPYRGTEPMRLLMKQSSGRWVNLGSIEDVE